MTDERDDRLLEAALGGRAGGLTPEDAREAARLRSAYLSVGAGAGSVPPPPALKERIMGDIAREGRRRAMAAAFALAASALILVFLRRPEPFSVTGTSGPAFMGDEILRAGDKVPRGRSLRLEAGARADLLIPGKISLRVDGPAELRVGRKFGGSFRAVLTSGRLFSRVTPGTPFSVKTPLAVAAVRGTTFYMRVEAGKSYICLCEGRLRVSAGGAVRDLETSHHAAVQAEAGGLSDAGMEKHPDEDTPDVPLP